MPLTRNQKKDKMSTESTGATSPSVQKCTLDVYLKPKQDSKTKTQESEETEEDIQVTLNKIWLAVKPIGAMNEKLDKLGKDFNSLKQTVDQHSLDLTTVQSDLKQGTELSKTLKTKIDKLEKEGASQCHMSALETSLFTENRKLRSEITKLEEYSRRNNLLFHGFDERQGEDCVLRIQSFLADNLDLGDAGRRILISKAHRMGPKHQDKIRPILVQFVLSTDVWTILKKRSGLAQDQSGEAKQKYYITKDYPESIVKIQSQLRPVLKAARHIDTNAHLSRGKLIFKDRAVSLSECYKIPELEVEKIGCIQNHDVTMFYGRYCPFSNFFPSEFVVADQRYSCVEQYFQKKKAEYSGAYMLSQQISVSEDPAEMKAITKPIDKALWPKELQHKTMKDALLAKFQQNKRLGKLLKDTGTKKMIECNRYDRYWGNGRAIHDKRARQGTGLNHLGSLLEEVRDLID